MSAPGSYSPFNRPFFLLLTLHCDYFCHPMCQESCDQLHLTLSSLNDSGKLEGGRLQVAVCYLMGECSPPIPWKSPESSIPVSPDNLSEFNLIKKSQCSREGLKVYGVCNFFENYCSERTTFFCNIVTHGLTWQTAEHHSCLLTPRQQNGRDNKK